MTASEAIEKLRAELADRLETMIRLSNTDDPKFLREMADLLMRVACMDGYSAGCAAAVEKTENEKRRSDFAGCASNRASACG